MTETRVPDKKINPAKRGDLFVLPTYSSITYVHGGTDRTVDYVLAEVTSVTREGLIKGYRIVGKHSDSRGTPTEARLVPARRVNVETVKAAYGAAFPDHYSPHWATLEQAADFLRPHLKAV